MGWPLLIVALLGGSGLFFGLKEGVGTGGALSILAEPLVLLTIALLAVIWMAFKYRDRGGSE